MEATKKTSTTRAALLVLAALSMLLSGLFIATASRSDATPPPACPDGFNLTADQKNCFQNAVLTSTDNPNTCAEGILTPDGTKCYVAARVIPQAGATVCPTGYSPDDSLGGMCARFEKASQHPPGCPTGAHGVAGACYILRAKGPAGAAKCSAADVLLGGVVAGTNCVITGADPVPGAGTCPVSSTVILGADGSCYSVLSPNPLLGCTLPYTAFNGSCKYTNPNANDPVLAPLFTCPLITGEVIIATLHTPVGSIITKIASCSYVRPVGGGDCPTGSTLIGGQCRRPVAIVPGAAVCDNGFGNVGGKCIRYTAVVVANPQCPLGSVEDSIGNCRKPVANAEGLYYCKDAEAALNGKSCVFVTGFYVNPAETQYKCDNGLRTVIGSGSTVLGSGSTLQVICILGDSEPNTDSGPSCLLGVLSTDSLYCIVPRIDTAPATAAPIPSFTG